MFPQKETRKKAVAEAAKATRTRAFMGKNDTRVIGYDGQASPIILLNRKILLSL